MGCGALGRSGRQAMQVDGQNFLFILSDQHRRDAMSCAGHQVVRTPNLDALAARGTRFAAACCNAPLCVPSRASIATGRHVHRIGNWDNCAPYCGETPSWAHRLGAAGIRTESIGKLHYRRTGDPNGFAQEHLPMHVVDGVGILQTICRDPIAPLRKYRPILMASGRRAEGTSYTAYDDSIAQAAAEWLEAAGRDGSGPFALFVSLTCPHPPWNPPEAPDPAAVDLPSAGDRPSHPAVEDFRRFFNVEEPFAEADLRRIVAAYYGMVAHLDRNVGRILAALEASGLAGRTRVLYASDHGEALGRKGLFGKCTMYEDSVGVPMILAGPGVPAGRVVATPVQLVDIYPTLRDSFGLPPVPEEADLPGTSLVDIANGAVPGRFILAEQHSAGARRAVFMLRDDRWKYVHYVSGDPVQLFDLAADPDETVDLGTDPAHAATVARLARALRAWCDPEAVDREVRRDQAARIAAAGGYDAVVARGTPGYSPAPGETPVYG